MPIIHHHADINLLVAVRGHPFDRTAFDAMFLAMPGVSATMVDQPAARLLMNPDGMRDFDALVLYDMPGLDFEHPTDKPGYVDPGPSLKAGFEALLDQGKGIVALHHALAGWPTWPAYAEYLGGRFLYRAGPLRGADRLDSGYAHKVAYEAQNVAPDHPVMAGVPATFPMVDELYLAEIFEDDVTPLLRSSHDFVAANFYSATAALNGRMYDNEGWDHPAGSNLIGWCKRAINSPLVYLQSGDAPAAYDNPAYRTMLRNAIEWVVAVSRTG
jgi:type 1 glutamine amidotransferase